MNADVQIRAEKCSRASLDTISCVHSSEPLVPVETVERILVEPIWVKPIDEIEGPLMQEYVVARPEYTQVYVREAVKSRLLMASESLPSGTKLILRAGHRPVRVQQMLLEQLLHKHLLENPGSTRHEALLHARQYVSDPAIKLPPHCCGAAVDVDLFDERQGKLVDFGCPVNTDSDKAHLFSRAITEKQHRNRMVLAEAMLGAGFACYYYEWWHYSYGDQTWACFYDRPTALYGITDEIPR